MLLPFIAVGAGFQPLFAPLVYYRIHADLFDPAAFCAMTAHAARSDSFSFGYRIISRLRVIPNPGNLNMGRTAADFIAETLAQAGVKRIYGVVGDSLSTPRVGDATPD